MLNSIERAILRGTLLLVSPLRCCGGAPSSGSTPWTPPDYCSAYAVKNLTTTIRFTSRRETASSSTATDSPRLRTERARALATQCCLVFLCSSRTFRRKHLQRSCCGACSPGPWRIHAPGRPVTSPLAPSISTSSHKGKTYRAYCVLERTSWMAMTVPEPGLQVDV